MRWPYDRRADLGYAWGAIGAGIGIAGAFYAARALDPHTAKSWLWPTNLMIIPVVVIVFGLILLVLPVRRSRRGVSKREASRFDRAYRAFVLAGLRFIDQKGLLTVGPFTPELDDIYVDVSLAHQPPHLVDEGVLPDLLADVTERRALREFLDRPDPVVLAVIGAPGSGKTMLLRHTARQVCQRPSGHERHLPILLYLRDHAAAVVADPDVALTALLRKAVGELSPAEPDGLFEQRLRNGECVVLLDGLDEVARPEDRRKVAFWAERQISRYPGNDYVITSRPQGYRAAKLDGAEVLQVRGFTEEQVSRFVNGWYLAMERHSTGAADEDITIRARREANDLLQRLDSAPALYDLTVNPLLLTMIANVHRYRGALPGSRADLYAEIIQVMLARRQEAKNLSVELAGDKKEALLRGLAYTMMDRRLSDLPHDEVLAQIRPTLRRLPRQVTAEGFLADAASNGLLVERESGLYCFAHHTFQEYLAAAYIHDKGLTDVLAGTVDDPWWRETTLLYTARADADPIVAACLNSGTITALALAFDCADQGSEFAEGLRDRLEGLLAEVANPATSQERRHLITGVLLTRHLHQQVRTSNGTRICTRPISASLYQLFRDDTQTPAPDSPPSAAAGTEPASGIRAGDAAGFVNWVNVLIGGETAYHLPSGATLDDPAMRRLIISPVTGPAHGIWIELDDAAPELWVPPGTRHPYQIDAETLAAHLDTEMISAAQTLIRLLLMRSAVVVSILCSYFRLSDRNSESFPSLDISTSFARAQEVIRDLARVYGSPTPSLAGRLEVALALALGRAWDFALGLDQIIHPAPESNRTPSSIPSSGHAPDLLNDLDRVLNRASAQALDLAWDAQDPPLNLTVPFQIPKFLSWPYSDDDDYDDDDDSGVTGPASDFDADVHQARSLAGEIDVDVAQDVDQALVRALDLDLDRAFASPDDLVLPRAQDLALVRTLGGLRDALSGSRNPGVSRDIRILDRFLATGCSDVMGLALSKALTEALRKRPTDAWPAQFSKAFTHVTGISGVSRLVSPGTLAQRLTNAVQELQATQTPERSTGEPTWAVTVSRRLQETASAIFNRQKQPTPSDVTSIRLAALCLAAEADALNQSQLGEGFREIAAGITLLERWAGGDDPATGTIVLASE